MNTHPAIIPATQVPDRRGAVAIMTGVTRDGDWILPRLFRVVAFWGGVDIDLTTARMGPGTSEIEVVCIMAGVDILVPPDIRVECDGDGIMGSFEIERQARSTLSPEAPLVRISGTAFWGAVTVKVIDPNAPDWLEKLGARWSALRGGQ
jgi:hypothetical protein